MVNCILAFWRRSNVDGQLTVYPPVVQHAWDAPELTQNTVGLLKAFNVVMWLIELWRMWYLAFPNVRNSDLFF